jgi:thioredoxin reductase
MAPGARAETWRPAFTFSSIRITGLSNVEVLLDTVPSVEGATRCPTIRWPRRQLRKEVRRGIQHLFLFIEYKPNTDWLSGSGVALDRKGFVLTGGGHTENRHRWNRQAGHLCDRRCSVY